MTDHLPECPWPEKPCGPDHEPMHDRQPLFCVACLTECICDELRACEQRMLDAAREAVERVSTLFEPLGPALAAIDALREEQAPPPLPPSVGVPSKPMWPLREEQK